MDGAHQIVLGDMIKIHISTFQIQKDLSLKPKNLNKKNVSFLNGSYQSSRGVAGTHEIILRDMINFHISTPASRSSSTLTSLK